MKRFNPLLLAALLAAGCFAGFASRAGAQGTPLVIVPRKADPNQLISFSFRQADIDDVLRFLADASGKMVFKDSSVQTSVTITNQSRIPVSKAIQLVGQFLALKGYALVETPEALIVSTRDNILQGPSKVSSGRDAAALPDGKEIVTHIIPLISADAVRLVQELTPLFPQTGPTKIASNGDTNSLVVVGEADSVKRVITLVNLLDRPLTDEITTKVHHLKYADAAELARYLTDLFRPDTNQGGGGGGGGGGFGGGFPGAGGMGGMGGGAVVARGNSSLALMRGRVRFAADTRINSLIIQATPANIEAIEKMIAELDVNLAPRTEYRIIPLKYADATGLADQINQLVDPNLGASNRNRFGGGFFGGFGGSQTSPTASDRGLIDYRVVADVRTNSLVITAPTDSIMQLEDLIKKLDVPSQVESVVRVFQLQNAIASETATTLRNLFQGTTGTNGGFGGINLFGAGGRTQIPPNSPLDLLRQVTIVANDQTNQLLISGPAQTFPTIERLLDTTTGLDRKLPQVFIEVLIADVTLDDETKFGIEWNAVSGTSSFGQNFGLTGPTADATGFRYSVLSGAFQATLQALKTTDRIKIINTPHVMVTDNSPAVITIGEQIPYAGQTTVTNGVAQSSVEFLDVAITLNVTPHISPGKNILMDIDQVVNSLVQFIEVAPNQLAPRTTNRRAGTTLIVKDNQTVVLGGIISNEDRRTVQKVPIIGDIPILGQFFRNTTHQKTRTELVVFLTPHIVTDEGKNPGDPDAADQIRAYERNRLKVDPLKVLDAPFSRPLDIRPEDLRRLRGVPDFLSPPREEKKKK